VSIVHPKQAEILTHVIDLLHQHTEENLTMNNIARRLDMAKSTLYEYYDSKPAMVHAALLYVIESNTATLLDPQGFEGLPFQERLEVYFNRLILLTQRKHNMQAVIYHPAVNALAEDLKEKVRTRMVEVYQTTGEMFHDILHQGVEEGVLHQTLSGTALNAIDSLFFGSVLALSEPHNRWDASQTWDAVYQAILKLHQ
jgi:AcrR family transcriptional regulator